MDVENLKQTEANLLSIKTEAIRRLRKLGFEQVQKPEKPQDIPSDITKLDDRNLGKIFQVQIAYEQYAGWELAKFRVRELIAEYNYDLSVIRESANYSGGVQAVKQQALRSKKVRIAKAKLLQAQSLTTLMESQYARFTRQAFLISREQSRRASEIKEKL